jgi:aminopeptidase 2
MAARRRYVQSHDSLLFSFDARITNEEQYDALLNFFRTSTSSDERNTALRCLGRAKDPELIKRTLDMLFGGEVKDQDIYMPASGLRSHPEGIEALFGWLTENWEKLIIKTPPSFSMLGTLVSIFTSSLAKQEQLEKVEKFFGERSTSGFDQSLAQSLDAIRSKISYLGRDREDVKAWLKENKYL